MPRSRRRRRRRYRVSRSYLHLNRGLTSPLATAMNFIPISYFWSPLWCARRAARSLLSIISVAAVTRHLRAVFRTFAREEAKKRSRSLRRLLFSTNFASSFSSLSLLSLSPPIPSPSQTRIPQTPPGSVKYVRDARLDVGDLYVRKCRVQRFLLFISGYLG